jgi:hypothetical protein
MRVGTFLALVTLAGTAHAEPGRAKSEVLDEDWRVGGGLFGAAFGPITYDRQSATSAAAGVDPQLASVGGRLGLERSFSYGTLDLHLTGRSYQTVENRIAAKFSSGATSYTELTTITSHGFGLGGGFLFRKPARATVLYPLASLEFERDALNVQSRSIDASGAALDHSSKDSVLYASYIALGARWRILSQPFEAGVQVAVTVPFFVNAPAGLNEHRTKPGIEVGTAFAFGPATKVRPKPRLPKPERADDEEDEGDE